MSLPSVVVYAALLHLAISCLSLSTEITERVE